MAKLSIIFVAGGWHDTFHVQPIVPHLEGYGYRVIPVTLKTSQRSDSPPTVSDNIDDIHAVIKRELDLGFHICVIGHSVSGQSCAGALSALLESDDAAPASSIKHVIFIACFLNALRACEGLTWYDIDYETMWATVPHPEVFYNDMDPEQAKPFVDALIHNRAQMPPEISDAWKTIPSTYLLCKQDLAIAPERQRPEAEENGMKLMEIDMGHCPYVSQPKELARIIDGILSA